MDAYTPTPRTRVRRRSKRGIYDKRSVHRILDEGCVCYIGFTVAAQPYVIPTLYARHGETLYVHGSAASRMLKSLANGIDLCVNVTIVDGYVLARSAFNHSLNYRSVVVLGRGRLVSDMDEKVEALQVMTNHIVPGRWEEVRAPNEVELRQTTVIAVPLEEVSAKVRQGPPLDDEPDYQLPVWAGVIPIMSRLGEPIGDPRLIPGVQPLDPARFAPTRRHP